MTRRSRKSAGLALAFTTGVSLACFGVSSQLPAFSSAYFDLEKEWIKTFNEGVTALDSNLYGKSEPLLRDAVSLSERFGAGDPRYPKSLGELGRLLTIRRRYAEAEPVLEQQLHFTEVQLGKNSGKTIPALGQMIKFYYVYGTARKAEPLAQELLDFIDGKLREDAEANAERAKEGSGKLLKGWAGTAPPATHIPRMDWAVTCDRLGDMYRFRKNFAMAERFYKAGLDVKVTIMGKDHMSIAVSYDNLGMLAMDKEEYADAEQYFRDSLETTKKIMGNGDPDTYARLDRLAKALIKEKKYEEAEKTYHIAMDLWRTEPNSGGATARCLYQLGSMYCDAGRFGQAAGVLSRALNMSVRANGAFAYANVPYLRKLGYALYYCGRHGEAESLKARANWLAGDMEDPVAMKAAVETAKAEKAAAAKTAAESAAKNEANAKAEKSGKVDVIARGGKPGKDAKAGKDGKATKTATVEKPSLADQAMKEYADHLEKAEKAAQAQKALEDAKAALEPKPVEQPNVLPQESAGHPQDVAPAVLVEKAASGDDAVKPQAAPANRIIEGPADSIPNRVEAPVQAAPDAASTPADSAKPDSAPIQEAPVQAAPVPDAMSPAAPSPGMPTPGAPVPGAPLQR